MITVYFKGQNQTEICIVSIIYFLLVRLFFLYYETIFCWKQYYLNLSFFIDRVQLLCLMAVVMT